MSKSLISNIPLYLLIIYFAFLYITQKKELRIAKVNAKEVEISLGLSFVNLDTEERTHDMVEDLGEKPGGSYSVTPNLNMRIERIDVYWQRKDKK